MKKKVCFILLSLFIRFNSYSQQQAWHWYFGNYAGLDFSSGNPVAVSNGAILTQEGCAAISDVNGNLLFYSDGVNVYNQLHQLMPNGTGLLGHTSSTQSALIVQKPGTTDHYYIFTTDAGEYIDPPNNGLHFSEVDMSLNGGTGDVIAATKNTMLSATASEKLCGVLHSNGTDSWVMAHGWNDSTFQAYLVTAGGVTVVPVMSQVGSLHTGIDDNSIGQMKFSPQGNKLALAVRIDGFFELFDFDNSTGIVSNPLHLQIPQFISAYGVEFSPDGSRLYVCTDSFNSLYQYDLAAGNPTAIINSLLTVGTISGGAGSFQLAPDGKIYVAHYIGTNGNQYLGKINFPNTLGTGCNYVNNAVNLGTGKSLYGLPAFVSSYFLPTGINENIFSDHFNIYFDWKNKSLKINVQESENLNVRLMDITSKEIINIVFVNKNSEVFLPQIKAGVYVFSIFNKEIVLSRKIYLW